MDPHPQKEVGGEGALVSFLEFKMRVVNNLPLFVCQPNHILFALQRCVGGYYIADTGMVKRACCIDLMKESISADEVILSE